MPLVLVTALVLLAAAIAAVAVAENIDPANDNSQFAWGENVGWLNGEPSGDGGPGVTVSATGLTGYIWGENIGWVSLSCVNTGSCLTAQYGVTNNGVGVLAGFAWAENAGWISFSCANTGTCGTASYGVTIDPSTGIFSGSAWGENIGWITFSATSPAYQLQTGWVFTATPTPAPTATPTLGPPPPDQDGDGIADAIDTLPTVYSENFSDVYLGGLTFGTVFHAPGVTLSVREVPSPAGVRIVASGSGGPAPVVAFCDPLLRIFMTTGDDVFVTCGSASVQVISGNVSAWFGSLVASLSSGADVRVVEPTGGVYNVTNNSSTPVILGGVPLGAGQTAAGVIDSDHDGLGDGVETNTGVFGGAGNTGTDPNNPDSDEDGLQDGPEVVIHGTNPLLIDTDGDGCRESQELGPDPTHGGQRDPLNHWDYFNPTGDKTNRTDDITAVVLKYGHDEGVFGDYNVKYDRTALTGGHPWQFGPPNGTIRTADVTAAVLSYGHDCA